MPTTHPILLLAFANDADAPLRELATEQDELRATFRQAEREGKLQLEIIADATAEKVIRAFLEYRGRIRIFHYGGHSDADAIFLKDVYQKQKEIKAENLSQFLALQEGLELVFLNSCLSLPQARQYQESGVMAVLATNQRIGDVAARKFARLFYGSLVSGATILEAYREAEAAFQVEGEDISRGVGLENTTDSFPWQLFPVEPAPWRLPLVARHLTRIPSIDLDKEFLGRKADMQRLKETLEASSRLVLMNGLGGIGKSVLATAYVQQYGGDYDHLAWIHRGEDLVESIALNEYLSDTLGLPFEEEEELKDRFRRILRKLQQLPGRNLLVIDNAQEQVAEKDIYDHLPRPPHWRVLLTSRLELGGFEQMRLDTLVPEAARALFRAYYPGGYSEEELEALLEEVGYHTLTVELLAKLLDKLNNVMSVTELTSILKEKELDDPDLQERVWARHSGEERGIYMHLMKAFELTKLTEQEQWLLKQFVVLPVERYAADFLADLLQEKPLRLNKVLNSLAGKGWLTRHEDRSFSIHRLVQQVAEYQLEPRFEGLEVLVGSIIEKMRVDALDNPVDENAYWVPHAMAVESFITDERNEKVARLQNAIAEIFRFLGQPEEALKYERKGLEIRKSIQGIDPRELAISYNDIGVIYNNLGNYEQALEHHRKSLEIRKDVLDDKNTAIATSYNNIAAVYRDLEQYEDALEYDNKALAIMEANLNAQHPELAIIYGNVAVTYSGLEQYQKALEYNEKALSIRETVLDPNHPDLYTSYNNIATVYSALGQEQECLDYHKKALHILESGPQMNQLALALTCHNIAVTYYDLNQYEKALDYEEKAITIRESILGKSHPDLAYCYHNYADIHYVLDENEKALHYYKKALAIRESKLDSQHPSLARTYRDVADTYIELGQYEEALQYAEKALAIWRFIFHDRHPEVADSYENLSVVYRKLGQYEKAKEYKAKAILPTL